MAAPVPDMPAALAALEDQPRVRDFLATALAEGRLSHAYLFVGAPGSGKHEAAEALAKCVVCPSGGDATCDECRRVAHRTHPDVRWLAPGSATGYLVAQVRELIADASLAPVRAASKVYVLERAELLRAAAANAFLICFEIARPSEKFFASMVNTLREHALASTLAKSVLPVPVSP